MDDPIQKIVQEAIIALIEQTASERNIQKSRLLHETKVHFIPAKYRILGGLIQSLNIKFGNFIEKLLALIVEEDEYVEALPESGKKLRLSITSETDTLIDQYITQRRLPDSPDDCTSDFQRLLDQIAKNETGTTAKQTLRRDVDALFRAKSGQIIYLEIKYNDDHDTGKFVDINRKFLKTYAGLVSRLEVTDISAIKPIIYYFNPVKRWGPIYVPSTHIYRGQQLFEEYFQIRYEDVDQYLRTLSQDENILAIFDQLYRTIRYSD